MVKEKVKKVEVRQGSKSKLNFRVLIASMIITLVTIVFIILLVP